MSVCDSKRRRRRKVEKEMMNTIRTEELKQSEKKNTFLAMIHP